MSTESTKIATKEWQDENSIIKYLYEKKAEKIKKI